MLELCARHEMYAESEVIPLDEVNEPCDRVTRSDVRYRFVI